MKPLISSKKKHLNVFESNDIDVHKKEKAHKCSTKGLDISQKVSLKQQEAEMSKDKKFKKNLDESLSNLKGSIFYI